MTQAPPAPPVEQCPRCGAEAQANQEYCLDCGLRLAAAEPGVVPHLAAAWQRRLPWYPGDWIWPAGLGLVLAAAGAVFAILYSHHGGSPRTLVATTKGQSVSRTRRPRRARPRPSRSPGASPSGPPAGTATRS